MGGRNQMDIEHWLTDLSIEIENSKSYIYGTKQLSAKRLILTSENADNLEKMNRPTWHSCPCFLNVAPAGVLP
jgi:hypothetical protein